MSDEPDHLDTDRLPPDGYLQPARRRWRLRCRHCGHEYWTRPFVKMPNPLPSCPIRKCQDAVHRLERVEMEKNLARMIEEQKPPGHIGDNLAVKAVDFTSETVMKDYGLTDLNTNMRQGDIAAPKLPTKTMANGQRMDMQSAADNFFKAGVATAGNPRMRARVAQLSNMALAKGGVALKGHGADPGRLQRAMGHGAGDPIMRSTRPASPDGGLVKVKFS